MRASLCLTRKLRFEMGCPWFARQLGLSKQSIVKNISISMPSGSFRRSYFTLQNLWGFWGTDKHEANLAKFVDFSLEEQASFCLPGNLSACLLCLSESYAKISAFNRNSLFLARFSVRAWAIWLPSSGNAAVCLWTDFILHDFLPERSTCSMLKEDFFSGKCWVLWVVLTSFSRNS